MRRSVFILLFLFACLRGASLIWSLQAAPGLAEAFAPESTLSLARGLASGPGADTALPPELLTGPGHAVFLAGLYAPFDNGVLVTGGVQIFLSLLTLVMIHGLARRLFPTSGAALAAVIWGGTDPAAHFGSLVLHPATLATFLTVAFIMLYTDARLATERPLRRYASAGLLLAAAATVRPALWGILVLALVPIFLRTSGLSVRRRFTAAGLFAGLPLLVLAARVKPFRPPDAGKAIPELLRALLPKGTEIPALFQNLPTAVSDLFAPLPTGLVTAGGEAALVWLGVLGLCVLFGLPLARAAAGGREKALHILWPLAALWLLATAALSGGGSPAHLPAMAVAWLYAGMDA